jgi:hypothetical protein
LASFPVIAYSIWSGKFKLKMVYALFDGLSYLYFAGLGYFIDQPLLINLSHNNFSYLFALVVFSVVILKPVLESDTKVKVK